MVRLNIQLRVVMAISRPNRLDAVMEGRQLRIHDMRFNAELS